MVNYTELYYDDLTEEQKSLICNGCGPKAFGMKVPQFCFLASCDKHDFNYWKGCTEEDRKKYDSGFFWAMMEDVGNAKIYKRLFYAGWALLFYTLVRLKGKDYFHYADNKRTKADLLLEIKRLKGE